MNDRHRILVFAHTPPPLHGQSYMVQQLVEHLMAPGGEIKCFHVNPRVSTEMEDIGSFRWKKIALILGNCLKAIWMRFQHGIDTMYYVPAPPKRNAIYRDWIVMLLCRPFFPRIILHWHAFGLGGWTRRDAGWFEAWLTQRLLGGVSLSLVLSKFNEKDARLLEPKRILVVANGIPDPCPDLQRRSASERGESMARMGLAAEGRLTTGEHVLNVAYLAHCTEDKGLFDVMEGVVMANREARRRDLPLRILLHVAGTFVEKRERLRFEKMVGSDDFHFAGDKSAMVHYHGFLSGELKSRFLAASDCFCFPTFYKFEGQPVNLIEAMAFGLPIITTRWRAIPEMLPSGFQGYVEFRRPDQIASQLLGLHKRTDWPDFRDHYLRNFSAKVHLEHMRGILAGEERPAPAVVSRRPLRVLQVFSRYLSPGGEESSVYTMGDAMQGSYDVEYFLASTRDLQAEDWRQRALLPFKTIHNEEVARRLRHFQEIGRFDVWQIHNVFPAMSPSVYAMAFKLGVPVVQYLHNYRLSCTNGLLLNHGQACRRCVQGNFFPAFATACWKDSHLVSGQMGLVLKRVRQLDVFNKVACFIALSEAQKREHIGFGISEEKIKVVPHFLEPPGQSLPTPPARDGHALYLGRLSVEKGVDCLLRAWARAAVPGKQKLYVVGEGPEGPRLQSLAEELGLDNVIFTGYLSAAEQKEIWEDTLFSIVPSIWEEPFGLVVLEAWARRRPVLAHRVGALPEILSDGQTGLLVEMGDADAMASAIERMFADPAEAAEMGRRGEERLRSYYSKERWLADMQGIYRTWE
jgi:glycosyltransferase involved in cell wall biosynthesis